MNLDPFLGLAGSVRARRNCCTETNLGSDWSVMLLGRGPTIQIYIQAMALCIPAVGESYDCAKAAISLERSNSFPWPEDCVQIHQTPFPSQRVGFGHETTFLASNGRQNHKLGGMVVKITSSIRPKIEFMICIVLVQIKLVTCRA